MNICKNRPLYILFFAICAGLIAGSANAQVDYALMLQQTPANGGSVSPDAGVHNISANGNVTVTATPKAGYQFVYWLGDVSDPTASSTVVSLNAPKVIVAVFERSEYELPFNPVAGSEGEGGGGDRLTPTQRVYGGTGDISPATGSSSGSSNVRAARITPGNPTGNGNQNVPVPGTIDTPEPATMVLLAVGVMVMIGLHNRKVTQ